MKKTIFNNVPHDFKETDGNVTTVNKELKPKRVAFILSCWSSK